MILPIFSLRFIAKGILFLLGIATSILLVTSAYVYSQFDGDAHFPVDCALVFGAAVHRGDAPGPGISRRTDTAVHLYNEEKIQTMILTGGKGSEEVESEAMVMRRVALLGGVDTNDILLEEESHSTEENLILSLPIAERCDTIVAISDRYHLGRIKFLAYLQGWGSLATYPAVRNAPWYFEVRSVVRESLAIVYTFIENVLHISLPDSIRDLSFV